MSQKMLTPEFNLKIKSQNDDDGDERGTEQQIWFNNHSNNRKSGSDSLKRRQFGAEP